MKRLSILLILTFILLNGLYSQEKNTLKEVGIYFSSFDAFGVRYKFGNEKRMFRLTAMSLNIGRYNNTDANGSRQELTNVGVGLRAGVEFPVYITDNLMFYYGGELSGTYNHAKNVTSPYNTNVTNATQAGVGFVLGLSHRINSNILLSAEIVPGLFYSDSKTEGVKTTGIGFGLNSNAAGITLSYKFSKQ